MNARTRWAFRGTVIAESGRVSARSDTRRIHEHAHCSPQPPERPDVRKLPGASEEPAAGLAGELETVGVAPFLSISERITPFRLFILWSMAPAMGPGTDHRAQLSILAWTHKLSTVSRFAVPRGKEGNRSRWLFLAPSAGIMLAVLLLGVVGLFSTEATHNWNVALLGAHVSWWGTVAGD